MRIAAVLAGGRSSRMGGCDKALLEFAGERLIDRVVRRLGRQVDRLIISGRNDYRTGLPAIADAPATPGGPVGGVLTIASYLDPETVAGFITAPVDAPFLPEDLAERLWSDEECAVAADGERAHPTFAYWSLRALRRARLDAVTPSLTRLCEAVGARTVRWRSPSPFRNVNTPDDLAAALSELG